MFWRYLSATFRRIVNILRQTKHVIQRPFAKNSTSAALKKIIAEKQATDRALDITEQLKNGDWPKLRQQFTPVLRWMLSEIALQRGLNLVQVGAGSLQHIIGHPQVTKVWLTTVEIPVQFSRAKLTMVLKMLPSGNLIGLNFVPYRDTQTNWKCPSYARLDHFREEEVDLTAGGVTVGATLTLPENIDKYPIVLLVSGSGPNDRDSTVGANKPFKDIAVGLASNGVGVLRFEKASHANKTKLKRRTAVTLQDEYMDHAKAAVDFCVRHAELQDNGLFILGHSLGAWVTPELAMSERVAGCILMAPACRPYYHNAIQQLRYFSELDESTRDVVLEHIQVLEKQATLADSSELSTKTPADKLPFGLGPAYWLSVREFQPVEKAKALKKPILILQGGRDYQVTVEVDLTVWQSELRDKQDAEIRVYGKLNHIFIEGQGTIGPLEYDKPGHVDQMVIEDICVWVKMQGEGQVPRVER